MAVGSRDIAGKKRPVTRDIIIIIIIIKLFRPKL
jgi:hypothetical protein